MTIQKHETHSHVRNISLNLKKLNILKNNDNLVAMLIICETGQNAQKAHTIYFQTEYMKHSFLFVST
jgi:hypothetical protein